MTRYLVFVYGTLLKGFGNHHLLEDSEFVGDHETDPEYSMYSNGSYPMVIRGSGVIYGEVYRVNDSTLVSLDTLEGYPNLYRREIIDTPYGEAFIYIYNREFCHSFEEISSGDWTLRPKR
ncbi:MAG TPA: gamma-glutamylcyclotransferase [Chromatiaceae bacterium]|jgi:gamma-glutamylcyclotransferase (GGCT)/AIG2-like uncharacterized protein YtfP|nr:gamma-glutamylcyclotransferase [Chromatiaceae bacterium]HIB85275.1 gamma-glutamylcyclotransferase [Chromatiaceae bacterium]HIO03009.1 gamma-glutamylcyclotransferase [Alphaproteobacteria bacterium]